MIPFEAMIEHWAHFGPRRSEARFDAVGVAAACCTERQLWIRADGHPELGTLPQKLLASFDPRTGRIVDKLGGEVIKRSIDQRVRV